MKEERAVKDLIMGFAIIILRGVKEMEPKKSNLSELRIEVPSEKKNETKIVRITEKKQEKLKNILDKMREDLERIERIRAKVKKEKISFFTPQQNKKIIEEIEVPALKMFREKPKQKS